MKSAITAFTGLLSLVPFIEAFTCPNVQGKAFVSPKLHTFMGHGRRSAISDSTTTTTTTSRNKDIRKRQCSTARHMYNLPPSGGGGGGNKDDIQGLLAGVGTIAATLLFFASPLGSIFFAITNSLFLLALLVPIVGFVGFQAWQAFYTLEGPCPNCGAPCRVLKDNSTAGPSFCFNCGAVVQASNDKNTIEIARESTIVDDGFSTSGSIFDILLSQQTNSGPDNSKSVNTVKEKESKYRRERTIIDVEIEED